MTRTRIPQTVLDAAHARSRARQAQDWAEADRLKAEIAAAGWRVVDSGPDFRLDPTIPTDDMLDGFVLHGSSLSVPSLLGDPPTGAATIVVIAGQAEVTRAFVEGVATHGPDGTGVVVVARVPESSPDIVVDPLEGEFVRVIAEVVRTTAGLGIAAALNAGIRRATGRVVILCAAPLVVHGDIVGPLVAALEDPTVAVTGGWGSRTADLHRFEPADADVDVVDLACLAFRREDAIERGPLDERIATDRYLGVSWSLSLRFGVDGAGRRGAVLISLPAERLDDNASIAPESLPADQARATRRDFYRVRDAWAGRLDQMADNRP